jgi:hypothetical protein
MKRTPALFASCLALISLACEPVGMSDELVEVTGEFGKAGHCNAHTPRGSLTSRDSGLTFHDAGGISGMAPAGYVVHDIRCQVADTVSRVRSDFNRSVTLLFAVRDGQIVAPGQYRILPTAVLDGLPRTAEAYLRLPAYDKGTGGAGFGFLHRHVSLEGVSGTLEISRADSFSVGRDAGMRGMAHPTIEGTFRVRMRRTWNQ